MTKKASASTKASRAKNDPLANVRIEPPRTPDEVRADANQAMSDAAAEAEEVAEDVPSVAEVAATAAAVREEKKKVTVPAKVPAKRLPRYTVLASQTVTWRGQQLRLKGGTSTIGDEKQGPGAIEAFRAMGVKMEEIK